MFGNIIRSFRVNNGLSQTNFVDVIQRSNDNFSNLDVVTLSRWERGVTTPHLRRQNELLDLIGVNIFDVWKDSDVKSTLSALSNKFNNNGYIDMSIDVNTEVNTINANNLNDLNALSKIIDVIFEYEENLIFLAMEHLGLSRKAIIEKIINQYSGELTLVMVNGQLIGHLLSSNYRLAADFLKLKQAITNKNIHLVVTFNCTHYSSFISTMGREGYKYLQNLNPDTELSILLKNKRMFDLFFSLGLESKSIIRNGKSMKIMSLSSDGIKSQRTWMDIITSYKDEGKGNE
ncbi:XRE family transcriptional regulator [Aliivibrio finisterrensis]|uniref:helix-turn-helix domain-containing protein n=1 Tax=Aliivibrio finisterrensis TaxID=511998 RepID=UPI0010215181|nr:helix-turn-helix transcriptional regulator [Aliivibrio finisterrensis]RYU68421.1 XRE family transcriptional regulator [Aliivibrio finisterrensis]RYU72174.1 XRE family transcriptional regulator [Aliivibrio finisterrensis]RYU75690.1 XRE family transcriptional regulator [Aliivibrio finisterrensis]